MERRSFLGVLTALPFLKKLPEPVWFARTESGLKPLKEGPPTYLELELQRCYARPEKLFERDDVFFQKLTKEQP